MPTFVAGINPLVTWQVGSVAGSRQSAWHTTTLIVDRSLSNARYQPVGISSEDTGPLALGRAAPPYANSPGADSISGRMKTGVNRL